MGCAFRPVPDCALAANASGPFLGPCAEPRPASAGGIYGYAGDIYIPQGVYMPAAPRRDAASRAEGVPEAPSAAFPGPRGAASPGPWPVGPA